MNPILIVLEVVVLAAVAGIIMITLALNTKSEGLGAAITGASDSYRGAVGVEEQKRRLLQYLCYGFVALSFIIAFVESWF
jgi:preprotein translocase subunit SecG